MKRSVSLLAISLLIFFSGNIFAQSKVIIAVHDHPFYQGKDGGLMGMIYKSAFEAVGMEIEMQVYPIKRGIELLFSNAVDAHSPGTLFIIGDQQNKITWVQVGNILSVYVFYRPNGVNTNVPPGSIEERLVFFKKNNMKLGITTSNPVIARYKAAALDLVPVETEAQLIQMLKANRVHFAVMDYLGSLMTIVKLFPEDSKNFDFIFVPRYQQTLAFSKGNPKAPELMEKFKKGFEIIKANGTHMKIQERYWGKGNVPREVLPDDLAQFGVPKADINKIPVD